MNKTKIFIIAILLILLAIGVLYGVRMSVQVPNEPEIKVEVTGDTIIPVSANYVSEIGDEAIVTYLDSDSAILTLLNTEYRDVQLSRVVSASGARYENNDLNLVLWEKEPELTIYKDDEAIFAGRKSEVVAQEHVQKILPAYTWIWDKTFDGTGPQAQDEGVIIPLKKDAFTLTFKPDGQVQGRTDCNSFGGTYVIENGSQIKFSSFMSTLMYCEGSQEQEFIAMIKDGSLFVSDEEIILENDKTVYFKRGE